MAQTVLWVYVGLLILGGLMGYLKAKSQPSLITSLVLAGVLSICASGILSPALSKFITNLVLVALLLFFGVRYAMKKKFMPAGLMVILSLVTLVLVNVLH